MGFDNYTKAFGSTEFWDAVKNTFIFTGISVTLELVIGLGMAIAMHAAFKGRGVLRTVVLVPWAVLTVVSAITWRTLFEPNLGLAPTSSASSGSPENVVWLGQEGYAMAVMVLADVWKTAPFMALLLLAGLQVIPDDVYDAAKVDGATAWQRFRRITLPLLVPAILVALIFRTLDALRIFDLPFVLTGRHQRHVDAVADRAAGAHDQQPDRLRLGAGGADVRDRDGRLVHLHPDGRRKHPIAGGGGLMEASRCGPGHGGAAGRRGAARPRRNWVRPRAHVARGHRDHHLLPVPLLLADQRVAEDAARTSRSPASSRRPRRSTTTLDLQERRLHVGAAKQRRSSPPSRRSWR